MSFFITMFFLFINCELLGQKLLWRKNIEGVIPIGVDNNGNVFYIQNDILYLMDPNGQEKFSYSNYNHGKFLHVNISNPFKIFVLNNLGPKVVILDNTLSPLSELLLYKLEHSLEPILVCPSRTEGFWIYDNFSGKIMLFSNALLLVYQSLDLRKLFQMDFKPVAFDWMGNYLLLFSRNGSVVLLDQFARIIRHTTLFGQIFSVSEKGILMLIDGRIILYDLLNFNEKELQISSADVINVFMQGMFILVQRKDFLELYKL